MTDAPHTLAERYRRRGIRQTTGASLERYARCPDLYDRLAEAVWELRRRKADVLAAHRKSPHRKPVHRSNRQPNRIRS
ncbi:MAG: hypothetical protein AAGN64_09040 [Bacteroidota bacterium]